ncbi:hypothetical protein BDF19DRAFT_451424 [Syncephalis fuscata]|nr:hypothetical protein BDF19DRAFT_451424 [Syncephalis fuscata]
MGRLRLVMLFNRRPMAGSISKYSTTTTASTARGWRRYTNQFRNAPATHITSFAILHEITAIVPIPIIYYALDTADIKLPVPDSALHEGERFARRLVARYGWGTAPEDIDIEATTTADMSSSTDTNTVESDHSVVGATSKVFVNLAIAYAVVKALMPVRIAACVALTPWFARVAVTPVLNGARKTSHWFTGTIKK